MQRINDGFDREQIQTLPIVFQKEEQLLPSIEEYKSLPTKNSGKITENMLPSFSATNLLVSNADVARKNILSTPLIPGTDFT